MTNKRSKKAPKKVKKTKEEKKTYLEILAEETGKIFRRRQMKPPEELLRIFSASHSPHKQPKPTAINDSNTSKKYYRKLSKTHKALIVCLRYDSLTDFSSIYRTIADISRRLGFPYNTIRSAL